MSCTGACCVAFPISCTYERLQELAADPDTHGHDGPELLAMLEPISHREAEARMRRLYPDSQYVTNPEQPQYFTCRHWNEDTRLCGNYDNRPMMCRNYPGYDSGKACEHGCDCTDRCDAPAPNTQDT